MCKSWKQHVPANVNSTCPNTWQDMCCSKVCLNVSAVGKPSVRLWINNTWLKWVSRRKGGFQACCQLFFLALFLWSTFSTATKRDHFCFLGISICLHFVAILLQGIPLTACTFGDNCMWRGGKGARNGAGNRERKFAWTEKLSFAPYSSPCPSTGVRGAPANSSWGIRRDFTASLVQNFVSYTNSSKHRQPLFVRPLFPSLYYYPLLLFHNTAAGNPEEEEEGGEEGKHLRCACPSFILGSL